MDHRSEYFVKKEFKNDPDRRMLILHRWFLILSPVAVVALLAYILSTLFYNPPSGIVFSARVTLTVFFTVEFLVEFMLYRSKKKFVKHYWWRAGLLLPVLGALRLLGALAQLTQVLSLFKMLEKLIDYLSLLRLSDEEDE